MNVKIKADGVFCSFEKIYEQCYSGLYQYMGNSTEWLFTERKLGTGYLQWELPGEGWQQLSSADPFLQLEINSVLQTRKSNLEKKKIVDDVLIQHILTTPDDSFVYFKKTATNEWDIKLTAWGYCYPVRINTNSIDGNIDSEELKQSLLLRMKYDGQPLPNKTFMLNEFERHTDENGELLIEGLPVGYEFDVRVDNQHRHITIRKDVSLEEFDLTQWATIEVKATLNEAPYANATVNIHYGNKQQALKLNDAGYAQAKVALSQNNEICNVHIDDAIKSEHLTAGTNLFNFSLTKEIKPAPVNIVANVRILQDGSPCANKEVELKYDGKSYHLKTNENGCTSMTIQQNLNNNICEAICDNKILTKELTAPQTEFLFIFEPDIIEKNIILRATINTEPYANITAIVEYAEKTFHLKTNDKGEASIKVIASNNNSCKVICEGKELTKELVDDTTFFLFEFTKQEEVIEESEVIVTTYKKGYPCKDVNATLNYNGKTYTLRTDDNGCASILLPILNEEKLCYAKVLNCKLQKKLEKPKTIFNFEIVEKTPWWKYLLGFLAILLFLLLALFTFGICGEMLFA